MAEQTYYMEIVVAPDTKKVVIYTEANVPPELVGTTDTFTHDNEGEPRTHTLWNHAEEILIFKGHIDPSNFTLEMSDREDNPPEGEP